MQLRTKKSGCDISNFHLKNYSNVKELKRKMSQSSRDKESPIMPQRSTSREKQ